MIYSSKYESILKITLRRIGGMLSSFDFLLGAEIPFVFLVGAELFLFLIDETRFS